VARHSSAGSASRFLLASSFQNLAFCDRIGKAGVLLVRCRSTSRISCATLRCPCRSRTGPGGWRPSLRHLFRRRPSPLATPSRPTEHRPTSDARPRCPCQWLTGRFY
jgi:hypothetical protein